MNWTDSLDWILRTSLGMLAVGLLAFCLRKKLSSSQRFVVWGGLFAFVACTFPFRGEFPQWTLSIARWMPNACKGALESLTPLVEQPVQEWLGQTGQFSTVFVVWGIVSALLLGRLLLSLIILSLHGSRGHGDKRARELLRSLQNELGIQRPVRLVVHKGSPMTWGILRHCVSLPESCRDWSDQRLELALRHEMAHIQRCDALWLLLSQMALALLWFHPVMWLVAGWMRREREMAADELVIQSGAGKADYAEVILSFSAIPTRASNRVGHVRNRFFGQGVCVGSPDSECAWFGKRSLRYRRAVSDPDGDRSDQSDDCVAFVRRLHRSGGRIADAVLRVV